MTGWKSVLKGAAQAAVMIVLSSPALLAAPDEGPCPENPPPEAGVSGSTTKADTGLPPVADRKRIFDEAGILNAVEKAGFDQLSRDLLFMKAGKYTLERYMEAYKGQFDETQLLKLRRLTTCYFEQRDQQTP